MRTKLKIQIKILKIIVDDRYYYIYYETNVNGKKRKGMCDGDYDSQTATEMKKSLENGYALELVLEQINL